MRSKGAAYRIAYYGLMLGFAMICGYVEALIPINIGLHGMKLGIANIVAMWLVLNKKYISAFVINTGRIILCGILFGNAVGMFYSLCGGTLAVAAMTLASRCRAFSDIGVGISGAVLHNTGQIAAAWLIIGPAAAAYLPPLMVAGVLTGALTGFLTAVLSKNSAVMKLGRNI